MTKDNVLVIHHNFFLNTTLCTPKTGAVPKKEPLIHDLTITELKDYDCGKRINSHFPQQKPVPGTQIPTLQELLDMIKSSSHPNAKKIRLNLEIKRDPRHPDYTSSPQEIAAKVTDLIKKNGFSDRVYYSSFDPEILKEIRKVDEEATLAFIFSHHVLDSVRKLYPQAGMDFILKIAKNLQVQIISPEHILLKNSEQVQTFQKMGFKVIPWTVNKSERWQELIKMGVDGIITDYPQELMHFLDK